MEFQLYMVALQWLRDFENLPCTSVRPRSPPVECLVVEDILKASLIAGRSVLAMTLRSYELRTIRTPLPRT